MSTSYTANQFDHAFKPHKLQIWYTAQHRNKRPTTREGHTTIIADDKGHLLPGVARSKCAWPEFKSTWELPARIQPPSINCTGRSAYGLSRMKAWGWDPQHTPPSQPRRGSTNPGSPHLVAEQDNGSASPASIPPTSPAPSKAVVPLPQSRPITGEGGPSRLQMDEAPHSSH